MTTARRPVRKLLGGAITIGALAAGPMLAIDIPRAAAGNPNAFADFDGDGTSEIVVQAEFEDDGAVANAGSITVLYANTNLTLANSQLFTQNTSGVPGASHANDRFGTSWAAGDFDNDGFDDLAVGSLEVSTENQGGSVTVFYGSNSGLVTAGAMVITQASIGVPDDIESGDQFGKALGVGDFDNDGYADLAIGAPRESFGLATSSGAVFVIEGSAAGLAISGTSMFRQGVGRTPGVAEAGDWFGAAVAGGDVNGDGFDDLAIGAPYEDTSVVDGGAVTVLRGSSTGVTTTSAAMYWPGRESTTGPAVSEARFGHRLVIGEIRGAAAAELMVCAPWHRVAGHDRAGAVWVLRGAAGGPTSVGGAVLSEATPGAPGAVDAGDEFCLDGIALGRVGATEHQALAVSVRQNADGLAESGSISIFPDHPSWPILQNAMRQFDRRDISPAGTQRVGDGWGANPQFSDLNGDGSFSLVVAIPGNDTSAGSNVGGIDVIGDVYNAANTRRSYTQNSTHVAGTSEANDQWGGAAPSV